MAKRFSIQVLGKDGAPLYLKSIVLRRGTIYPTDIAFTSDKRYAATFESAAAIGDASDAVDSFIGGQFTPAAVIAAHRNSQGIVYEAFP